MNQAAHRRRAAPWMLLAGGDLAYKAFMAAYWVAASRTLPKADVGTLAFGTALAVPVYLILDAGFSQLMVREYRADGVDQGLPHGLLNAYRFRLKVGAAAFFGIILVGWLGTSSNEAWAVVSLFGVCYGLDFATQFWIAPARAGLDMRVDALIRAIQGAVPLAALLILHALGELTTLTAAMTSVAAYSVAALVGFRVWGASSKFSFDHDAQSIAPLTSAREFNAPFTLRTAYARADAIIIQIVGGPIALANYTAASKLVEAARVIPGSIGKVVMAQLSTEPASGGDSRLPRAVGISVITGAASAVALAVLGPWVIELMFGPSYAEASTVAIRLLATSLLITSLTVAVAGVFLAERRSSVVVRAAAVSLLTTCILGVALTSKMGIDGTAVAVLAGEFAGGFVFILDLKTRLRGLLSGPALVVTGGTVLVGGAVVAFVPANSVYNLVIAAAAAAALVAVYLVITTRRRRSQPQTSAGPT